MKEPKVIDLRKQPYDIVTTKNVMCISTEEVTVIIDGEVLENMQRAVEL